MMMPDEFERAVDRYAELHEPAQGCTLTRREYAKSILKEEQASRSEWTSEERVSYYLLAFSILLQMRAKKSGDPHGRSMDPVPLTVVLEQRQMAYVDRLWHYMSDEERDRVVTLCDPDIPSIE